MMQALVIQRMNQGLKNVLLANHVLKGIRAPFSGENLIAHIPSTAAEKRA
jgi:hypothetical protein